MHRPGVQQVGAGSLQRVAALELRVLELQPRTQRGGPAVCSNDTVNKCGPTTGNRPKDPPTTFFFGRTPKWESITIGHMLISRGRKRNWKRTSCNTCVPQPTSVDSSAKLGLLAKQSSQKLEHVRLIFFFFRIIYTCTKKESHMDTSTLHCLEYVDQDIPKQGPCIMARNQLPPAVFCHVSGVAREPIQLGSSTLEMATNETSKLPLGPPVERAPFFCSLF